MQSLLGVAPLMTVVESSIVAALRTHLGLTLRAAGGGQELRRAG
jgi:hypothetical protein